MNSRQRLLAALEGNGTDRVPANITYYMPAFYEKHFSARPEQDPWESRLESHTRFGFDPLIGVGGGRGRLWELSEPGRWEVRERSTETPEGIRTVTYAIETPEGSLSTVYSYERGHSGWQEEPLIKDEADLAALACLPPAGIDLEAIDRKVNRLGDRGLGFVSINGIWQEACYLRGMTQMAMDLILRPEWTSRFLGIVADFLARQTEALCRSSAEALFINESYLGMGISSPMFERFVRPFDQRFVDLAKGAGKLVLYHDCGRCDALLEQFAEMGIDYLEPLNPRAASGDVDPQDAKRRIGDRVCLRGGFNHHLMDSGTPRDIEEEVRACLAKLAPGGRYILCPAGAIQADTPMENLLAYAEAAEAHCGQYGSG